MSKMGYNKVLKSAIAKVTITSFPEVNAPIFQSSEDVELSNCKYTYAKKGSSQSYNATQITGSRVSTSLLLQKCTSVFKEFRTYSYSSIKPIFNVSQETMNNILKVTKDVMDVYHEHKKALKK